MRGNSILGYLYLKSDVDYPIVVLCLWIYHFFHPYRDEQLLVKACNDEAPQLLLSMLLAQFRPSPECASLILERLYFC